MASRNELIAFTGCEVGAVHPFAPGISIRLLDERTMSNSVVSFNTGDMARGILISPEALASALTCCGAELCVCDIAAEEDCDNPLAQRAVQIAEDWGLPPHDARFIAETSGAEEYLAEYAAALTGPDGRPELGAGATEEARPMYWLRLLSRLAAGAGLELVCVPPTWLAALVGATAATRYAREDALRRYVAERADPGLPSAAKVEDVGQAAAQLVEDVLAGRAKAYAEWLSGVGAAGWDERRAGKVVTFLMGDAMKACRGGLPPGAVRAALLARMRHDADVAASGGAAAAAAPTARDAGQRRVRVDDVKFDTPSRGS